MTSQNCIVSSTIDKEVTVRGLRYVTRYEDDYILVTVLVGSYYFDFEIYNARSNCLPLRLDILREEDHTWHVTDLSSMFTDTLHPTEPEIQMFELTHGLDITDAMSIVHNIIKEHRT